VGVTPGKECLVVNRMNAVSRCALGLLVLGLALGTWAAAYAAEEGWLGVMLQPLTGDLSEAMNIGKDVQGVVVNEVVEGSPAEAAGLAKGDVIIEIDGATITSTDNAIAQVRGHAPGDKVKIVVLRDGKREVVTAVLGEREDSGKEAEATKDYYNIKIPRVERIFEKLGGDRGGYLGVTVHDMSADLGSYFGVRCCEGVLVLDVLEDTPAQYAGLRAGDVIIKIGDQEVGSTTELLQALGDVAPGEKVDVVFKRSRETRRVEVEVAESPDPIRVFINKAGGADEWAPPCCGSGGMGMQGGMMPCMPGEGDQQIR
jgi:serine protease Do